MAADATPAADPETPAAGGSRSAQAPAAERSHPAAASDASGDPKPERVVLRDPASIKALAHPARLAVLDEFLKHRELTATECAAIAGLSPSAMSYHLRSLARWGIITPAGSPDGRERRWKLAPGGFAIIPDQPAASAAASTLLVSRLLERQRGAVLGWFADQAGETDWQDATVITTSAVMLTPAEAQAVGQVLIEAVEALPRRDTTDAPPGARSVLIGVTVVPEKSAAVS
ncbi:MAG: winged helix-turn-helix domain-containing protein [bacterium]